MRAPQDLSSPEMLLSYVARGANGAHRRGVASHPRKTGVVDRARDVCCFAVMVRLHLRVCNVCAALLLRVARINCVHSFDTITQQICKHVNAVRKCKCKCTFTVHFERGPTVNFRGARIMTPCPRPLLLKHLGGGREDNDDAPWLVL